MCEIHTSAIHEAGHTVIHHLRGNRVVLVTMCNDDENPMVRTADDSNAQDLIIGGFAGPWAHKLFSDQVPTLFECSEDFAQIDRLLDTLELDRTKRAALRDELKEQSRKMVIANERRIKVVAEYLIKFGDIGNPAHSYGKTASEILYRLILRADEMNENDNPHDIPPTGI